MKLRIAFLLVYIFIGSVSAQAQNSAALVQVQPAMPKVGTTARITYNAANRSAVLKNVSEVWLVQRNGEKEFEQYKMTKQAGKWTVQIPVDFGATYVTYYFKSSGAEDLNGGHLWDFIAADVDGKPAKNAYYMRAFSYGGRGYTKEEAEKMQLVDWKKEAEAHSDAFYPNAMAWKAELAAATTDAAKEAVKTRLKTQLTNLWNANKGKYDYYSGIQTAYRLVGLNAEADAFKADVLAQAPSTEITLRNQLSDALRAPKGQTRCDKINAYMAQNGGSGIPSQLATSMVDSYAACKDQGNVAVWIERAMTDSYSKQSPSRTYARFAQMALGAGMNDLALDLAQKAIAQESKEFFSDFMHKTTETEWKPTSIAGDRLQMARDNLHGENLKSLAKVYAAKNDLDNAISSYKQAASLLQNDKDIFPTLAKAYEDKNDLQAAFDVFFNIAKKDRTDAKAIENLKRIYEKMKGSSDGYADVTSNLERIWATKPAPVYSVEEYGITRDPVQDLQMTLADAKQNNKTVMLFVGGEWCTWCHALTRYFKQNEKIAEALQDGFIIMKVNYSTENENKAFLDKYPSISGYPHLFFLDSTGKLLFSQSTGEIESGIGMGYDQDKILAMLHRWSPNRGTGK